MRMMRLYLASLGFGADASFLRRPAKDGRALVIRNARDGMDERVPTDDAIPAQLRKLGYASEELDLREYFDAGLDDTRLADRIDGTHLVWAVGGNPFVLARAMRQARFSRAIARPLREGSLTYGGFSAGACVAGPDLQGMHLMTDPAVLPDGYDADVEPETLGLVPFRIVPHWKSVELLADEAETVAAWLTKRELDHRTLRDDEVITFG